MIIWIHLQQHCECDQATENGLNHVHPDPKKEKRKKWTGFHSKIVKNNCTKCYRSVTLFKLPIPLLCEQVLYVNQEQPSFRQKSFYQHETPAKFPEQIFVYTIFLKNKCQITIKYKMKKIAKKNKKRKIRHINKKISHLICTNC